MLQFHSAESIRTQIRDYRRGKQLIGFVPTMGALHAGHMQLVKQAIAECDRTVVSIFVNPEQFNNAEDFENYPSSLDADLELLMKAGCDLVFTPSANDIYPTKPEVSIQFGSLASKLEGKFRPGHFSGVGLIVSKLFNITIPDRAYFGLKDLQQYLLIRALARDLNYDLTVIGVDTCREASGLAMSSRNIRLSENGKLIASNLYKGLNLTFEKLTTQGPSEARKAGLSFFENIKGLDIEYLEIVDTVTMQPLINLKGINEYAICVAGYVEGIRLIDNLYLR